MGLCSRSSGEIDIFSVRSKLVRGRRNIHPGAYIFRGSSLYGEPSYPGIANDVFWLLGSIDNVFSIGCELGICIRTRIDGELFRSWKFHFWFFFFFFLFGFFLFLL